MRTNVLIPLVAIVLIWVILFIYHLIQPQNNEPLSWGLTVTFAILVGVFGNAQVILIANVLGWGLFILVWLTSLASAFILTHACLLSAGTFFGFCFSSRR